MSIVGVSCVGWSPRKCIHCCHKSGWSKMLTKDHNQRTHSENTRLAHKEQPRFSFILHSTVLLLLVAQFCLQNCCNWKAHVCTCRQKTSLMRPGSFLRQRLVHARLQVAVTSPRPLAYWDTWASLAFSELQGWGVVCSFSSFPWIAWLGSCFAVFFLHKWGVFNSKVGGCFKVFVFFSTWEFFEFQGWGVVLQFFVFSLHKWAETQWNEMLCLLLRKRTEICPDALSPNMLPNMNSDSEFQSANTAETWAAEWENCWSAECNADQVSLMKTPWSLYCQKMLCSWIAWAKMTPPFPSAKLNLSL